MFLSRVFALAVAALASVSFVGAVPTAGKDTAGKDIDLVKRDSPATVLDVLNLLNTNLDGPVGQINSCVASNNVSMSNIQGPCNNIVTLITGAVVSLQGVAPGPWNGQGTMPSSYHDCVIIIIIIIQKISVCLNQLLIVVNVLPGLLLLVVAIDTALSSLLILINVILIDVVVVAGGLIINIQGLLGIMQSLALILTLGCLGL